MKKIACNIVTFNRKALLKNCLIAVVNQTFKPYAVYITDNASTDGTVDAVKEWGYYNTEIDGIKFKYILNSVNEGSSGGQYLGMKTAFEDDTYDGIWVMDDDGVPTETCLQELVLYLDNYHYISPLVIPEKGSDQLSFSFGKIKDVNSLVQLSKNGVIEKYACPFNGILYSRTLIERIGFPKREMFIWGDENNYDLRCRYAGFYSVTILNAIHLHPFDRQNVISFMGLEIREMEILWKAYCYFRNAFYNMSLYNHYWSCFIFFIKYLLYYITRGNYMYIRCLFNASFDGLKADFSKLRKYKV